MSGRKPLGGRQRKGKQEEKARSETSDTEEEKDEASGPIVGEPHGGTIEEPEEHMASETPGEAENEPMREEHHEVESEREREEEEEIERQVEHESRSSGAGYGRGGVPATLSSTSSREGRARKAKGGDQKVEEKTSPPRPEKTAEKKPTFEIMKRPGYGKDGRPIDLLANYYQINMYDEDGKPVTKMCLHRYNVNLGYGRISSDRKGNIRTEERLKLFWYAMKQNQHLFDNQVYNMAYDGASILITRKPLNIRNGTWKREFRMEVTDEPGTIKDVVIEISPATAVDEFDCRMVTRMIAGASEGKYIPGKAVSLLQMLNIIFRQGRISTVTETWRNYYPTPSAVFPLAQNTSRMIQLGFAATAWHGLFSTARVGEVNGKKYIPMLNMDISNGAFYKVYPIGRDPIQIGHCREVSFLEWACDILNSDTRTQNFKVGFLDRSANLHRDAGAKLDEYTKRGLTITYHIPARNGQPPGRTRHYTNPRVLSRNARTYVFEQNKKNGVDGNGGGANGTGGNGTADNGGNGAAGNGAGANGQPAMVSTSVFDYFGNNGILLDYPDMPVLQVKEGRGKNALPMEFCTITFPQRVKGKLDDTQVAAFIKTSALPAPNRQDRIQELVDQAKFAQDNFVGRFGLALNQGMLRVRARILGAPKINHGATTVVPADGVWRFPNRFMRLNDVGAWALVMVGDRGKDAAQSFLCEFAQNLNRNLGANREVTTQGPIYVGVLRGLTEVGIHIDKAQEATKKLFGDAANVGIIYFVLPGKDAVMWSEIKRVSEIEKGVLTQCLLSRTVQKYKPMTGNNIAMKVNAKKGGNNWIAIPNNPQVDAILNAKIDGYTMIVGIDVTHPPPGDKRSPSIAGIVSSLDEKCSMYQARLKVQKKRNENVIYMKSAMENSLRIFFTKNGTLPSRIIVYRDGVSEGMFGKVMEEELLSLNSAVVELTDKMHSPSGIPKMTYIIVNKRHHTRFFCEHARDQSGKGKNIPPGSAVDNTIVHPEDYDFFLCPHQGIQGTCRPVHYYILKDDNNLDPDCIQHLTNLLCYNYVRCTRAVHIPAPLYYADLICTRGQAYLKSMDLGTSTGSSGGFETGKGSSKEVSEGVSESGRRGKKRGTKPSEQPAAEAEDEKRLNIDRHGDPIKSAIHSHDTSLQNLVDCKPELYSNGGMYWV